MSKVTKNLVNLYNYATFVPLQFKYGVESVS